MTIYDFNVDRSNPQDRKLFFEFVKEMKVNTKNTVRKHNRDRTLANFLKSSAIMASGFSMIFLPKNPNELRDRLKLILQEKQAGDNSDIIIEEIVAIVIILLDSKCIFTKQHKILVYKCLNLMKNMK